MRASRCSGMRGIDTGKIETPVYVNAWRKNTCRYFGARSETAACEAARSSRRSRAGPSAANASPSPPSPSRLASAGERPVPAKASATPSSLDSRLHPEKAAFPLPPGKTPGFRGIAPVPDLSQSRIRDYGWIVKRLRACRRYGDRSVFLPWRRLIARTTVSLLSTRVLVWPRRGR